MASEKENKRPLTDYIAVWIGETSTPAWAWEGPQGSWVTLSQVDPESKTGRKYKNIIAAAGLDD